MNYRLFESFVFLHLSSQKEREKRHTPVTNQSRYSSENETLENFSYFLLVLLTSFSPKFFPKLVYRNNMKKLFYRKKEAGGFW